MPQPMSLTIRQARLQLAQGLGGSIGQFGIANLLNLAQAKNQRLQLSVAKAHGRAVGQVFLREDYGLLLPDGSPHLEEINRALLALRENGEYGDIYRKWFGKAP